MTTPSPTNDETLDDPTPAREPATHQGWADRWPRTWYWVWSWSPAAILSGIVILMMFPGPDHPLLEMRERVAAVLITATLVLVNHWGRLYEGDPRPRLALRQVARRVYGDYNAEVLPGLVISPDGDIQARVFVGGPWLGNPGHILGIEIVPIICPGFPIPGGSASSAGDPLGHHRAHDDWEQAGADDWPTNHNLRDLPETGAREGTAPLTLGQVMATPRHAMLAHPDGTPAPLRRPGDVALAAREIGREQGRAAERMEEDDLMISELLEAFEQAPAPLGRGRSSGVGRLLHDLLSMDQAGEFTIVPRPATSADEHDEGPNLQAHVPARAGVPLGDPLVRGMGLPEDRPTVRVRRGHLELLD